MVLEKLFLLFLLNSGCRWLPLAIGSSVTEEMSDQTRDFDYDYRNDLFLTTHSYSN